MTRKLWFASALVGALGAAGCGDDDDGAAAPGPTPTPTPQTCTPPAMATTFFADDVHPILTTRCIPCHGDAASALPRFGSADRATSYDAAAAVVDTTNPTASRLLVKANGGEGHPDQLDPAQVTTVTTWVRECAQNNARP